MKEIEEQDVVIYHYFDKINNSYEQRLGSINWEIVFKWKIKQDEIKIEEFWINE